MPVSFFLHHKDKDKSNINAVLHFKGKLYKRSTGESVIVKYWRFDAQCCKEGRDYSVGRAINTRLKKIALAIDTVCNKCISEGKILSNSDFWKEVDIELNGGAIVPDITFTDYLENYIKDLSGRLVPETIKKYVTALHKLRDFENEKRKKLSFQDINMRFYDDFEKWMYKNNYTPNYFGAIIKIVKIVFREARETDHLHNFDYTSHRDFKTISEMADTIYLTEDELLKIYHLDITEEKIRETFPDTGNNPDNIRRKINACNVVRNKFLIGAFTALRVSDFNRLDDVNIKTGFISIRTQKTGSKVIIPIHWVIEEILDSGFDISVPISNQKINTHIKEICRMAGITESVEIEKVENGKKVTKIYDKCDLVTTHTARRSGATNMYKAGIPTLSIMKITGHKTEKSFLRYIKITAEENALMLAQHSFFKKPE